MRYIDMRHVTMIYIAVPSIVMIIHVPHIGVSDISMTITMTIAMKITMRISVRINMSRHYGYSSP
jgi:hypothetical protein